MSVSDPLIVMGGGPSLKIEHFDLVRGFDTIGMNGAYRYYYKSGWWPRYFCCFDNNVTQNHASEWRAMIEDPNVPIERFFFLHRLSDSPKLTHLALRGGIGKYSTDFSSFGYGGNTGCNACQVGVCLGYKKLLLIGMDCDYKVEIVDGAKRTGGAVLQMEKTPDDNPNYFIPDYQQKGDVFNMPQAAKFHRPAWEALSKWAPTVGVEIINCGVESKLECFPRSTLEAEVAKARKERENAGFDKDDTVP